MVHQVVLIGYVQADNIMILQVIHVNRVLQINIMILQVIHVSRAQHDIRVQNDLYD